MALIWRGPSETEEVENLPASQESPEGPSKAGPPRLSVTRVVSPSHPVHVPGERVVEGRQADLMMIGMSEEVHE